MESMNAIMKYSLKDWLNLFFSVRGRIARTPYAFGYIIAISTVLILFKLTPDTTLFLSFNMFCISYIHLMLMTKRLRDLNKPIWLILLTFIPIANGILWLYLLVKSSENN